MAEPKTKWELLHSKLPSAAIKPLATAVYGVAGLSDVNEGFLVQRLFASGFEWSWRVIHQEYLGAEERPVRDKDYTQRYYLAEVHGELSIDGRVFHGSGASDNRKIDAAFKGANTVAFKNACKWAGLTSELFLDGRAIDHIYGRILKDPDMVPERTVEALVEKITETYGDPAQTTQQDERQEAKGSPPLGSATTPAASSALTDAEEMQGANDQGTVFGTSAVPAPASPLVPDVDDRQPLYALARTLKLPRTAVEVDAKIAKQGLGPVRMELILAHGRDCRQSPCEHVAALSGLLAVWSE